MSQTFEAIFENGVLRPLTALKISEHAKVLVSIEDSPRPHPLLKHCGTVSDEDTAEIQRIIEEEFEKVDPNDWK